MRAAPRGGCGVCADPDLACRTHPDDIQANAVIR
jgi:hypothetical protein